MSAHTTRLNDPSIFTRSFQMRRQDGPCKDPCDFVMKFGGEAMRAVIASAKPVIDYKFDILVAQCLQAEPNAHAQAIEAAVGWFAQYIAARSDLEPDHPALISPFKKGAIICRLAKLSGLTVEEVRRIIDYRTQKLTPPPKLKLSGAFPVHDDPRRDAVLDQLESLRDADDWSPPDLMEAGE